MEKYIKENFHFFIFILVLICSTLFLEPTIEPDTQFFIEAGRNLFNSLANSNFIDFKKNFLNIEILFKFIPIINISIFFQLVGEKAKYILAIINLVIFFFIFKLNCTISKKINFLNNNRLSFLIIIFFSFFYLPVFLLSYKILTEVYFQFICVLYLQQLYLRNTKLKNLFLLSLLSIFINPMGLILVGFTMIIIIKKIFKMNLHLFIILTLFTIIFFTPFALNYLLDNLYLNIYDYNNLGRLKFLEKGNIIYSFLYYDQGSFKWCDDYCNFTEIYQTIKSNSSYYDYLISGLLRIFYFIYPTRPYFSFNHNFLISISMIVIYLGFIFSFKLCKIKNYLPLYFILFYITFFIITPLAPSYRYQSAFYLMLIPNAANFYSLVITRIYEKYFN
jgi:hypothetical protein